MARLLRITPLSPQTGAQSRARVAQGVAFGMASYTHRLGLDRTRGTANPTAERPSRRRAGGRGEVTRPFGIREFEFSLTRAVSAVLIFFIVRNFKSA